MKKIHVVFLFIGMFIAIPRLIASPLKIVAEGEIEVVYRHYVMDENGSRREYYAILTLADAYSIFQDYALYQRDSVLNIDNISPDTVALYNNRLECSQYFFEAIVVNSLKEERLDIYDMIPPDRYCYQDVVPSNWMLGEVSDTIASYPCQDAQVMYGGKNWLAWYTLDIPKSFGPWKLGGLPGLILRAQTTDGVAGFEAISIRQSKSSIMAPTSFVNATKTVRSVFVKKKLELYKDPEKNILPESLSDVRVITTQGGGSVVYLNGVRYCPYQKYIPLEE